MTRKIPTPRFPYSSGYGSDEEMTAEVDIETKSDSQCQEEAHARWDADSLGHSLSDILDVNYQPRTYILFLEGEGERSGIKGSARQIMERVDPSTY